MLLTNDDKNFFYENGYLIKRNVLDKTLIPECIDFFWKHAPAECLRDSPETWASVTGVVKYMEGPRRFQHTKYYWKIGMKDIPAAENLIARCPEIREAAENLIPTDCLIRKTHTRGIIAVLPGDSARGMHLDSPASGNFICVTGYLDDVDIDSGGFAVCPKSHHLGRKLIPKLNDQQRYWAKFNGLLETTEPPLEFTGRAGDVMFWDYGLLHQHVKNESNRIRFAMFTEFRYGSKEIYTNG